MKFTRQLVRNGNSTQVGIPSRLLEYLGWTAGNAVVVQLTERSTIEVRPVTPADVVNSKLPAMTLDRTRVAKVG